MALELGRFPGRYKKPANDTEVRENNLAMQLSKQKRKIPAEWWEKVQQLKEKQAEDRAAAAKELKASELMRELRQLGHYPDQHVRAEVPLYQRLKRARSEMLFQPADEAELQEMEWVAQRQKREAALERAASVAEPPAVLESLPDESTVPSFGQRDVAEA